MDILAQVGQTEPAPWLKFQEVSAIMCHHLHPLANIPKDGNILAEDVYQNMYHDVDQNEAEEIISKLRPQAAVSFGDKTRGAAWRKIPSAYLVCEDDRCVPAALQDMMIEIVRKEGGDVVVERLASSHSPYIKDPAFVAGFLERAAA